MRYVITPLAICMLVAGSTQPAFPQTVSGVERPVLPSGPVVRRVISTDGTMGMMPTVALSPDQSRVAYVDESDGGVYVRDLASGAVWRIAGGIQSNWSYLPVWSHDGRRLAFSADGPGGTMSVFIADSETGEARATPGATLEGWVDAEDWSMDGRSLLLNVGERSLAILDLEDGSLVTLTDSAALGHGSLSPDGGFVAYVEGTDATAQIYVQSVAGTEHRQITWAPGHVESPLWAPDGSAIAFLGPAGIWVVPMANGRPEGDARLAISASGITLLQWTVGGVYFAQSTQVGSRAVPYQISVDPATGTPDSEGIRLLPGYRPDTLSAFAWSADMQHIALGHRLSPQIAITSAEPEGVVIWDLGRYGHVRRFHWGEDGREVRYEPDASYWPGAGSTLLSLDVVSGQVRELFPRIRGAAWFSLSDDGRTMSYYERTRGQVHVGPAWPSAGDVIGAVIVSPTGEAEGRVVATAGGSDEVPFSNGLRPVLTRNGDRVLYVRQAIIEEPDLASPEASSLWVAGADGSGTARLATAAFIQSAIWDPTGRYIAYTAKPVRANDSTIARIVNVASGEETVIALPGPLARHHGAFSFVRAVDWSKDGTRIGFVVGADFDPPWECWVIEGLR